MSRLYEWKQMNNNTSNNNSSNNSSAGTSGASTNSYKNRFKKLINYAQTHIAPMVTKTEVVKLEDYSFEYREYYEKNEKSKWVSSVKVNTSRFGDRWSIIAKTDEIRIATKYGEGYEDLLSALAFFINTPHYGTPEYNNLLVESLTETAEDFKTYETMWD